MNTRISRENLLAVVAAWCELAPSIRHCPTWIAGNSVTVTSHRTGGETLALFSATPKGKIRITKVVGVEKKFRDAAGIKNNRVSVVCKPTEIIPAYDLVILKYNNVVSRIQPHIDKHYTEAEQDEQNQKTLLREVSAYGTITNARVFREHGTGKITWLNSDGTIDVELTGITRSQLDAVLAILGRPVAPKVTDEYVWQEEDLTVEQWNEMSEDSKSAAHARVTEDLFGKFNRS